MKKTISYVERSKEDRDKYSNILSGVLIISLLAAFGFIYFVEILESKTTCNGISACLVRVAGNTFLPLIGAYFLWKIIYIISYFSIRWKQVDPKDIKHNKKVNKK